MIEIIPLFLSFFLIIFLIMLVTHLINILSLQPSKNPQSKNPKFPTSYPVIGHMMDIYKHKDELFPWVMDLIMSSPSYTFIMHRPFGQLNIITANPTIVEHILKTRFSIYEKGPYLKDVLGDLLSDGIFNADGESWKFQRQIASYEFSTRSLTKFIEIVVDNELSSRLIPILSKAAEDKCILDFQDILQRFAFDNICQISFGYDPKCLTPCLPQSKFAISFEDAVMVCSGRLRTSVSLLWKMKRFFNVGHERKLREAVHEIREFATFIVKQKKQRMMKNDSHETEDLLSRLIKSGLTDENFITDIVISFILAGRDTTSSALTWFFWLLYKNKEVEEEIVKEVKNRGKQNIKTENSSVLKEVKDLIYIQAALCESMRFYPPVPIDTKQAATNDVLPNGMKVNKGMRITYYPYAMGRMETIWGPDWTQYRPERWLEVEDEGEEKKWKFVSRDPYSYPVFQAGPRICLGKEMAFLQMKRVVAGVLERFKVVPVVEEEFEPVFLPYMTAKMQGGLPVRIEKRREAF